MRRWLRGAKGGKKREGPQLLGKIIVLACEPGGVQVRKHAESKSGGDLWYSYKSCLLVDDFHIEGVTPLFFFFFGRGIMRIFFTV